MLAGALIGSLMTTSFASTPTPIPSPTATLTPTPSPTPTPSVIDNCAAKSTGKIRKISSGECAENEWSLGAKKLTKGKNRPKALRAQMKARFKAAQKAAGKKGHSLNITSGWRSLAYQQTLYDRAIARHGSASAASKWVLPPKKSMHPWGLAIDVNYGSGSKAAAKWLEKNGYKYGLCRRYDNEWWHFEPLVAPGTKCPAREPYAK
jgi:LAS superfamily LD-carboxypeptidase LdcB